MHMTDNWVNEFYFNNPIKTFTNLMPHISKSQFNLKYVIEF